MKKSLKKILIAVLCLLLLAGIGTVLFLSNRNEPISVPDSPSVQEDENESDSYKHKYDVESYWKIWRVNKEINPDYQGQILFPSGLLNEPFVQGEDDSEYLRKDWKTGEYLEEGTIFLSSLNELEDRNLTLYGHYIYESFDPTGYDRKFTPLKELLKKENYEANKEVLVVLENDVRIYEVASVFFVELEQDESGQYVYVKDDDLQYYWRDKGEQYFNYDDMTVNEGYFNDYARKIRSVELYPTGIDLDFEESYLTLQTCVEGHEELREIVFCKEVYRIVKN